MTPADLPANFAAKIHIDDRGCWIFTGAIQSSGYGCIALNGDGTHQLAHRAAYQLLVGDIPAGLVIDHLCLRKNCVNPEHLEAVTVAENNRRARMAGLAVTPVQAARNAAKTHCKHGHPFDDTNTRVDGRGWRMCLTCRRDRDRERYERVTSGVL